MSYVYYEMTRYDLHYGICEHQYENKCAFNIGGKSNDERYSTGLSNLNGFCYNTFTEYVFLNAFCFQDEFVNDTVLFVLWSRFFLS